MKALVVGGTGPTGPFLVDGLLERGFDVTIFHRGTHEIDEIPPQVEHIHGDPHFLETIQESLKDRQFDIAIATYGRIRFLAEALVGKVGRFISIGGVASYRGYLEPERLHPTGMPIPASEAVAVVDDEAEHRFSYLIAKTEQTVLDFHPEAAHFRYPYVYGPRQLIPREWSIMRRVLDARQQLIIPDGGRNLTTRGFAGNLAHAVLLAVDNASASAGQIYNCGDTEQYTLRQFIELIAQKLDHEFEFVNLPDELARPAHCYAGEPTTHHRLMDTAKLRTELAYRDKYSVSDALDMTLAWLSRNKPAPGGDVEQRLQDSFDYAGEDALIDAWRDAIKQVAAVPVAASDERPHPYAHPKKPGERDHRNR